MTTDRIKFQALRPNQGRTWLALCNDEVIGSFGWNFRPANCGAMFASNHRSAPVRCFVRIGQNATEEIIVGRATFARQADKLAREWLRANAVRDRFAKVGRSDA